MTKLFVLFALIMTLTSCGKKGDNVEFYPLEEKALPQFVNQKNLPSHPDFTQDKTFVNRDYPIYIALYKDGNFAYDLPNLTEGTGTWTYDGKMVELRAKLTLFDMYISVHGADETGSTLGVKFTDRFGPNRLKMENINFE